MAEYLIYNTDQWMSKTAMNISPTDTKRLANYNARNIVGDIIEVRPDGYWTIPGKSPGFNKDVFVLIKDESRFEDVKKKYLPLFDTEGSTIKKCQFYVDLEKIVFKDNYAEIKTLEILDKI